MTKKNEPSDPVVVERALDAPVAQVWKALTDVDAMRVWYFELKEFIPKVGFEFEFTVEHEGFRHHRFYPGSRKSFPQKRLAVLWRYGGLCRGIL